MEFLTGNPFSTPVGQQIEHATSPTLPSEDWALNMEICDIVNETEEGPRDAVRAIKKRIVGNKNFKEVTLALTVLEACVKNCGHRFHVLVSTREFIEGVLVRAILPRNNPPLVMQDRVLSLIQAWADAFRSSPDLTGVVSVYEDLRRKGLEFPNSDLDALPPILTPSRSMADPLSPVTVCSVPQSPKPSSQSRNHPQPPQPQPPQNQNPDDPLVLSPQQLKRLRSDVQVVRGNLTIMADMMTQMHPGCAQLSDKELLQLYGTCKDMQDKLVELIPRISEEKLIEELLVTNDEINTTFTRYKRFERLYTQSDSPRQCPTYANLKDISPSSNQSVATSELKPCRQPPISSLSSQMAGLHTEDTKSAQKQNHSAIQQINSDHLVNSAVGASNSVRQNSGTIPLNQASAMDDIEQWLEFEDEEDMGDTEGVTSEEFDRFLAERAKAADRLPSVSASQDPSNSQPNC
ncbi:target of Myb protein 1 isoform X2 [Clupea harengus]|uniref:Target of Myb protein 1 isoform X2 n=1 Tax=Clupea harengus TaxID=7950 RepID=A0A6P8FVI6_CLUHA|nr:target of Myb protein 1 isoform X2 [Clupea harengus]